MLFPLFFTLLEILSFLFISFLYLIADKEVCSDSYGEKKDSFY